MGDSKFREFEESTFRRFEVRGPVGLWTFQIRGVTLFGWGDLKKTALFSVKGGVKRELWMFFRLTPWGGGGGVVIRVR